MSEARETAVRFTDASRREAVDAVVGAEVSVPRTDAQRLAPGAIVADDVIPRDGQVTESQFLDTLARRLASVAIRSHSFTEGMSHMRQAYENEARALLEDLRAHLFQSRWQPDHWLRGRLGLPDGAQVTPEDIINALLDLVDLEALFEIEGALDALPEDELADRYSGEGDGSFLTPAMVASATFLPPTSGCGGSPRPAGSIPSWAEMGRRVHHAIQEDYRRRHPHHRVLLDSRVYFPDGGSQTVRQLSQGRAGYSPDLALLDYALTMTSIAGRKRPDILNLDTREIYEIKPRSGLNLALLQLEFLYQLPLNAARDHIRAQRPDFRSDSFTPGMFREWQPQPVYHVPPRYAAKTCWDPIGMNGTILYDVFQLREPQRSLVPVLVPAAFALFAMAVVLIDPIPGDEVVLVPALAPLLAL